MIQLDTVGILISGSSAFSKSSWYIWKFLVHVLLRPSLEDFEHYLANMWKEHNHTVVWAFFSIAFLWDWNENWHFPVLWPLLSFPNLLASVGHPKQSDDSPQSDDWAAQSILHISRALKARKKERVSSQERNTSPWSPTDYVQRGWEGEEMREQLVNGIWWGWEDSGGAPLGSWCGEQNPTKPNSQRVFQVSTRSSLCQAVVLSSWTSPRPFSSQGTQNQKTQIAL